MHTIQIGLLGDYDPNITAHACIPLALQIGAKKIRYNVISTWLTSETALDLNDIDGIWCVPGSPYKNRSNVLSVIRFARTNNIPYLGTCGGYQHAILEFAKNELQLAEADLEEENPSTKFPLISSLPCRLTDESKKIYLNNDTKLSDLCGTNIISGEYRCGYGMNPAYTHMFNHSKLKFVAFDEDKIPQAFEVTDHPFFIGTAFQPERSVMKGESHPLVEEFLTACLALSKTT